MSICRTLEERSGVRTVRHLGRLLLYVCETICVCVCEHRGRRAGRQSALSKQVTPEGCVALELWVEERDSAKYTRVPGAWGCMCVCVRACSEHYVELCHSTGCVISLAQGGVSAGVCAHTSISVCVCVWQSVGLGEGVTDLCQTNHLHGVGERCCQGH